MCNLAWVLIQFCLTYFNICAKLNSTNNRTKSVRNELKTFTFISSHYLILMLMTFLSCCLEKVVLNKASNNWISQLLNIIRHPLPHMPRIKPQSVFEPFLSFICTQQNMQTKTKSSYSTIFATRYLQCSASRASPFFTCE